ncbi:MAG: hypothetical protein IT431_06755 [Phycisphaerales bacterium]|nr:hypothetical protein [Phycisphaerales bacterium]
MVNSTQILSPCASRRELSFGSWTVQIRRSPERIRRQVADFAVGVRWAWFGAATAVAAIAVLGLTGQ